MQLKIFVDETYNIYNIFADDTVEHASKASFIIGDDDDSDTDDGGLCMAPKITVSVETQTDFIDSHRKDENSEEKISEILPPRSLEECVQIMRSDVSMSILPNLVCPTILDNS